MNIFEKASRLGLKFKLTSGITGEVTTDYLWTMRYERLLTLGQELDAKVKEMGMSSRFKSVKTKDQEALELQLEIVTFIVDEMEKKDYEKKQLMEKKAQDQKIMELIEQKKDETLKSLSIEQLTALLSK